MVPNGENGYDGADDGSALTAYEAAVAVRAAYDAAVRAACYPAAVKYWVNEYFEVTGENREEYEKALEEMRK